MASFTVPDIVAFPNSKTAKAALEGRSRFAGVVGSIATETEAHGATAIVGPVEANTGHQIATGGAQVQTSGTSTGSTEGDYSLAQVFTPMQGQTVFTLAKVPTNPAAIVFWVNGVAYEGPDFTISDVTVTWAGTFNLSATDEVRIG